MFERQSLIAPKLNELTSATLCCPKGISLNDKQVLASASNLLVCIMPTTTIELSCIGNRLQVSEEFGELRHNCEEWHCR